jgi:hypothetical protein
MIKNSIKLKKYNISVAEIAEMFEYKNEHSFLNSKNRDRDIKTIINVISVVEEYIIGHLKK